MAETVKSMTVKVIITSVVAGDDGADLQVAETYEQTFGEGTGSGQVGTVWQDKVRPLNATSEDLDLVGSTSKDFQGANLAFNCLKMLYLRDLDEDSGDYLMVGGAAATQVTGLFGDVSDAMKVGPKGILLWVSPVDGVTITSSTDLLKLLTADNSTFRVILGGDNA